MLVLVGMSLAFTTACNPSSLLANPDLPPQLVQAILEDPKTFNFVIATDATTSLVESKIFDGLVTQNPLTGKIEPALAESWDISEDKLRVVFTLRQNLQWSDGHPLTAEDVDFTYNQLYFNPEIPASSRDGFKIGESKSLPQVRQLNDLQIEFILPEPFAPFLGITGTSILPKHILEDTVKQKDRDGKLKFLSTWTVDTPPEQIIASSAYKLKSYDTAQRVIFEANPYYWKKALVNRDIPYIKRVIFEIIKSSDTFLIQFRSGSLDSVDVAPEYFSLLKKEEKKGNFTIYNGGPDYGTNYITFNLNTGKRNGKPLIDPQKSRWFNNLKFRQAVAYAIDRPRMVKNIYRGLGQPQHSFISVQSPFADENLKAYDYDPEKAKQLLREGGFKYNNKNQLFDAEGNRVKFTLNTNSGNKIRENMGNQVEEDLEAIGMDVNFRTVNFNVLIGKLSSSLDWECIMLGLTGGNEPNNGANVWFTDGNLHMFNQKPAPGQQPIEDRKVSDWEKEIDRLFIQGARELNEEKRKLIYAEIQQLVSDNVPFIYLVNPKSFGAVRNKIKGIEYTPLGGAFWNLEELKITE
ncbi:ABC transporter substrate-binding protein [Waterburya agarophytonicola K14]|uniref:ABC transporter substrate-binding protein n=1 Tax=Waterburya agarophytonicola KI4 TaxID=2874699 RepID=A0A964C1E5_9CYAN|nr:ABC transporter substrate-binding protein [Waterburya agarophytonicola]MCC0179765.1 ABC transporter substrate-binding protein [Waterburya agarophytonicola KI4]